MRSPRWSGQQQCLYGVLKDNASPLHLNDAQVVALLKMDPSAAHGFLMLCILKASNNVCFLLACRLTDCKECL